MSWSGRLWTVIFVAAIAAGAGARVWLLERHFTHTDDTSVATILISLVEDRAQYEAHTQRELARLLAGESGSPRAQQLARRMQAIGILPAVTWLRTQWNRWHVLPRTTTYAPAQFYLTRLLVHPGQSYSRVKTLGRLPSLLFGLLAMAAVARLLTRMAGARDHRSRLLVGVALIALSWQCIIYAAQMESYAIGVFAAACVLLLLERIASGRDPRRRDAALGGAALAALAAMQYQVLFFLPAFYAAALYALGRRLPRRRLLVLTGLSIAGFAIVAVPLVFPFLLSKVDAGLKWNAGPSGEFAMASAFVTQLPLVVMSMLSPVHESSPFVPWLTVLLTAFVIVGFAATVRAPAARHLAIFAAVTAVVWVALVAGGKLSFGPTRHSMALIPLLILFAAKGFEAFTSSRPAPALVFAGGWCVLFLTSAPIEFEHRTDRLSEPAFAERLRADRVDAIAYYGWSEVVQLMPSVRRAYPVLDGNQLTPPAGPIDSVRNGGRHDRDLEGRQSLVIAFYSGREPFAIDSHQPLIDALGRRYGLGAPEIEVLREHRTDSTTEVDWSSRTRNGTNGHYYTVVRLQRSGSARVTQPAG